MNEIKVWKAQSIGGQDVEGVTIVIDEPFPTIPARDIGLELKQVEEMHVVNANKVEQALWDSLPGGTYNRLLAAMLNRKAGYLVVREKQNEM